jgi:thioredoxin reductase (NADPH)
VARPAILTVDDDPAVSHAIARDLQHQFGTEYQIVRAESAVKVLTMLSDFALKDRQIALIVSDQRMPDMTGVEFLEQARQYAPDAKLVLLTAYAESEVAIKAINDIGLDYYLLKPWDPPEERLYGVVDDLLDDWQASFHPPFEGIRIVGHRWSPQSSEVRDFLARNYIPYQWLNVETEEAARQLMEVCQADAAQLPHDCPSLCCRPARADNRRQR